MSHKLTSRYFRSEVHPVEGTMSSVGQVFSKNHVGLDQAVSFSPSQCPSQNSKYLKFLVWSVPILKLVLSLRDRKIINA